MTESDIGKSKQLTVYSLGSVDKLILKKYHLVRFIHREHLESCRHGNFLIVSVARNKDFDDKRSDNKELNVTIKWKNEKKEQWVFKGDDFLINLIATVLE